MSTSIGCFSFFYMDVAMELLFALTPPARGPLALHAYICFPVAEIGRAIAFFVFFTFFFMQNHMRIRSIGPRNRAMVIVTMMK